MHIFYSSFFNILTAISSLNLWNCFRGKFIWRMMLSMTYWHRQSQTQHFRHSLTSSTLVGLSKSNSVIKAKLMFLFIRSHWSPFILFEGKSKTAEGGEQDDGSFSTSTSAQECDETGHVDTASERCKMCTFCVHLIIWTMVQKFGVWIFLLISLYLKKLLKSLLLTIAVFIWSKYTTTVILWNNMTI